MYSGLREQSRWALPAVLLEQARSTPDRLWIETISGEAMTFGEAETDASRVAGHLASLGVRSGEMVAVMLPNGLDLVRVWLGLGKLGAVAVLLNTELTGGFLSHQLNTCGANLAIVDGVRFAAIQNIAFDLVQLKRVVTIDDLGDVDATPFQGISWSDWRSATPYAGDMPRPQDTACVMYTSGTSGPSKAVLMPHAHCYLYGLGTVDTLQLTTDDRYYIVLPLFHANGLLMQLGSTLIAGCRAIVRERFSASAWLDDARRHGATVSNGLGAVAAFIVAQPSRLEDRDHRMRAMLNVPNVPEHEAAFRGRFGIRDIVSGFGMTEVNMPVWGRLGQSRPGAAGWVHADHFEVIIANPETDKPVSPGEVGEILVRPKVPFGFMAGYHAMPDKTVEAWRNLWFHTGDAATMDETGLVTFVDRLKDCIRRRGENIAATEVEAAVEKMPGVAEVAAYAVPSGVRGGEDEIMLAVVAPPGARTSPSAVAAFARRALPRFAQPRYIEILSELPKTATGKVLRAKLRQRGVTSTTWDAERNRVD